MKKLSLLTLAFLCFSILSINAQQIPNASFEDWTSLGTNTERPIDWHTVTDGKGNARMGSQTIWRDINPHTGTYCSKIKTVKVPLIGIITNGALVTGAVCAWTFSKADGCVDYVPNNANYTANFTTRPDSIVFWYKYAPQGSDSAKVEVILGTGGRVRTPDSNNVSDPYKVGTALWFSQNANVTDWTRIAVKIDYVSLENPQYILISCTSSSNQMKGTENSTMWVDDFLCIYDDSDIKENKIAENELQAFSYNNTLIVNMLNKNFPGAELSVYSVSGKLVGSYKLNSNSQNQFQINTGKGIYFYNIISEGKSYSGKVFIN
jgi:hypothetical protein